MVILSSKKYDTRTSIYLALLILITALSAFQFALEEVDIIDYTFLFDYLFVPWSFLMPALFYWFVELYINSKKRFSLKEKLLYLPFGVMLLLSLVFKGLRFSDNAEFLTVNGRNLFVDFVDVYAEFFNIILCIAVLGFCLRRIQIFQKITKDQLRRIQITWLKVTLIVMLIAIALWLLLTILLVFESDDLYYTLYLLTSATIYFLGYAGIYKIGIERERLAIRDASYSVKEVVSKKNEENTNEFKALVERKQLYLDTDLSLEKVSKKLEMSKSHLSRTINKELGESFSDYINKLRVEEAKKHLNNPEFFKYTILAIGLESGFNSKSTFNKAFKKFTGKTPSQYKKASEN